MITFFALAAAAAVLLWPSKTSPSKALPSLTVPSAPAPAMPHPAPASQPTYQAAIAALAEVRTRLNRTERLGDKESQAIDTITLALVAGSDAK